MARNTSPMKGSTMTRTGMTATAMLAVLTLVTGNLLAQEKDKDGFVSLFDGKSLEGWKVNESPDSFSVKDGAIVAHGPRAHLFYDGRVQDHNFKNFHFKADVMTNPVPMRAFTSTPNSRNPAGLPPATKCR